MKLLPGILAACIAAPLGAQTQEAPPPAPPARHSRAPPGRSGWTAISSDPGWKGAAVMDTFYETLPGGQHACEGPDRRADHLRRPVLLHRDPRPGPGAGKNPRPIRGPGPDRGHRRQRGQSSSTRETTAGPLSSCGSTRAAPGGRGLVRRELHRGLRAGLLLRHGGQDHPGGVDGRDADPVLLAPVHGGRPADVGHPRLAQLPARLSLRVPLQPDPAREQLPHLPHAQPLTGLTGLPSGGHIVRGPLRDRDTGRGPRRAARDFARERGPARGTRGIDAKWTPTPDLALDATLNPDFSQVEADVAQIAVNERFALFFPEKRPFFLEGVDLFNTPIQAVHTRTITSPRWGTRATGKSGLGGVHGARLRGSGRRSRHPARTGRIRVRAAGLPIDRRHRPAAVRLRHLLRGPAGRPTARCEAAVSTG